MESNTISYTIHYYPQAEDALSSLNAEERNRVHTRLCHVAEDGLSGSDITLLNSDVSKDPTYVLHAGNNLLVVFAANRDRITVLDVLNRRFAERYG